MFNNKLSQPRAAEAVASATDPGYPHDQGAASMTMRTPLLATAAGFVFIVFAGESRAAEDTMQVTANVVTDCELTANDFVFGAFVLGNGDALGEGSIEYDCAAGIDITIEIGPSLVQNGSLRTMTDNATGSVPLAYELFQDDGRSIVWSEGAGAKVISSTPGGSTSVPVYGLIPASGQVSSLPEGTYSDTLTVTLDIN